VVTTDTLAARPRAPGWPTSDAAAFPLTNDPALMLAACTADTPSAAGKAGQIAAAAACAAQPYHHHD
jgi:hypothetical protein